MATGTTKCVKTTMRCAATLAVAALFRLAANGKGIVILHENDVHCRYAPGYATLDRLRNAMSDTAFVAVVSAGDYIQGAAAGAVSKGKYITDIMRAVRYDAVTIGNHEFDYGIDYAVGLLGGTADGKEALPVTCVNFRQTVADTLVYKPYITKRYGDKSVAYIGAVTAATMHSEATAFLGARGDTLPYRIADGKELVAAVQRAVDEARRDGADYVVVLSHLGDNVALPQLTSQALAAATRGVDAVLDGHTHLVYTRRIANLDGKEIPVTQTGARFANIGKLYISEDGKIISEVTPLAEAAALAAAPPTPAVTQAIEKVDKEMSRYESDIVATAAFPLPDDDNNSRRMETAIGDLVADAFRHCTKADIAVVNGGGVRAGLPSGDISTAQIIGVQPFFNDIIKVRITGRQLLATLTACSRSLPGKAGEFLQVSGVKYTVRTAAAGNTVEKVSVLDTLANKYRPLDLARTYTLAASRYVVRGTEYGGTITFAPEEERFLLTDADMLAAYVRTVLGGEISRRYRRPAGRITIK